MSDAHRLPQMTTRPFPKELDPVKFRRRETTADGAARAFVDIDRLETVWFNTGTLCNIECLNCYIESSPSNDRLEYLDPEDLAPFLEEIERQRLPVRQIGFTGGEPFVNPRILDLLRLALDRSFDVLVLTNAMRPMMRPPIRDGLEALAADHGHRLVLRVSIDHYTRKLHDEERGAGSWDASVAGLCWLSESGFRVSIAGRHRWGEADRDTRRGYAELCRRLSIPVDCEDPGELVLFPEMDASLDVPEITVDCWNVLGISPEEMMCARSRMVVKRRGASEPVVLACTLIPYDSRFELGTTLAESLVPVYLNHPHCARFCALGGGSCSPG